LYPQCLPEADAEAVLQAAAAGLLGEPQRGLLHHGHELVVVYAPILQCKQTRTTRQSRSATVSETTLHSECCETETETLAYVVLVHLPDHVLELHVAQPELLARQLQLVGGDVPAAVLVEVLERREQVVLPLHLVQVQRRRDELAVVDRATIIHVRLLEMGKIAAQIYLSGTAKIPFHSYFGF